MTGGPRMSPHCVYLSWLSLLIRLHGEAAWYTLYASNAPAGPQTAQRSRSSLSRGPLLAFVTCSAPGGVGRVVSSLDVPGLCRVFSARGWGAAFSPDSAWTIYCHSRPHELWTVANDLELTERPERSICTRLRVPSSHSAALYICGASSCPRAAGSMRMTCRVVRAACDCGWAILQERGERAMRAEVR